MSTATARHQPVMNPTATGSAGDASPLAARPFRPRRDDPLPLSRDLTVQAGELLASTAAVPADGPVAAARELWRQLAGETPDDEANALYAERKDLLARVMAGDATKVEKNRLALVRWHLERIEDAKHGEGLDKLEALSRLYAQVADRVRDVVGELERVKAR